MKIFKLESLKSTNMKIFHAIIKEKAMNLSEYNIHVNRGNYVMIPANKKINTAKLQDAKMYMIISLFEKEKSLGILNAKNIPYKDLGVYRPGFSEAHLYLVG